MKKQFLFNLIFLMAVAGNVQNDTLMQKNVCQKVENNNLDRRRGFQKIKDQFNASKPKEGTRFVTKPNVISKQIRLDLKKRQSIKRLKHAHPGVSIARAELSENDSDLPDNIDFKTGVFAIKKRSDEFKIFVNDIR